MYVKKFAGDSLDETLKLVKQELGPDAIILKTVSNKGIKSAFKKSRIEITAAISEQNYAKKSKVDKVLNDEQKEKFYQAPASNINNLINDYAGNSVPTNGYGNIGLNKVVNTVSKASNKIKNSLDDFLSVPQVDEEEKVDLYERVDVEKLQAAIEPPPEVDYEESFELRQLIKSQSNQIDILEQKLFEITQSISSLKDHSTESEGLKQLRTTLRTLDLNEKIVQDILKKASFELNQDDINDPEVVYDFALRELNNSIVTDMPLFSSTQVQGNSVITVLVSDGACGQSSMGVRLAVLKDNANIIKMNASDQLDSSHELAKKLFDLEISNANNTGEILTFARKSIEDKKHLIIDLKMNGSSADESKKIIETLKRSFDFVEVLVTVSAINSELYNRKILSKYQGLSNGVIITYVDQCMDYGALVNAHYAYQKLPLKFYGTGPVIPEDIEAATAERILAGMFQF